MPLPTSALTTPEQEQDQHDPVPQRAGLQAVHLLHGQRGQWAHLDARYETLLAWTQKYLKDTDQTDDASRAPYEPETKAALTVTLSRVLQEYTAKESFGSRDDVAVLICLVIDEMTGLGPIEPLWRDPNITEVMVNGPDQVFVEIGGRIVEAPGARFTSQERLLNLCQRILAPLGRTVDPVNPLTDGRLPDGSRVNVVHQNIAPNGPLLTIRRFPGKNWTLADLVDNGSIEEEMATELAFLANHKASMVVVGGTGSGKTTLLNALSSCIPVDERIVTVEDSLELRLHPAAHVAAMEGRPAAASGAGAVSIRDLVKNALRMRPSRVIVGEVRDAAALDMLQAMNTGHEGSMTTVHANGAEEAVTRLSVLVAQGGEIPEDKVQWLIGDAVDIFVVQSRYEDGSRRVSGIYEVPAPSDLVDGRLIPKPLWVWEQTGIDEESGRYIGRYIKHNEISERLRRLRRLDQFQPVTIDDIRRFATEGAH